MSFRKIAPALCTCLALGTFGANAAQAAQWTLGTEENQTKAGSTLTKEGVECHTHPGTDLVLTSTLLGSALEVTVEGVECFETYINTVAVDAEDHSEGKLTLLGVKVLKPANCLVPGAPTTNLLTDKVIMDPTAGSTVVFDRFFTDKNPEGVEVPLLTFELIGALCALAETTVRVGGSVCGEAVHTITPGTYTPIPTGTLFATQTLRFGEAQQKTATSAAEPCALKVGAAAAQLSGAVDNLLSGIVNSVNKEKPFGAD
jgi:hypothetical protein